ncbi:ATP-binding protein [Nonomuraea typhae]|uniref:ATP-binding protein n=1 Tax=Nonomuraea typhae TaxID=2603600 RepID=A0ABW7Z1C3_9ACTN
MLHGRDTELATIDQLLAEARDGRPGALILRGEAGIGKSALLDHAAAAAQGRVLRATALESEAELPYAALHLLLRPGPDRLDAPPPQQACGAQEHESSSARESYA